MTDLGRFRDIQTYKRYHTSDLYDLNPRGVSMAAKVNKREWLKDFKRGENVPTERAPKNTHKVKASVWKSWGEIGQRVFNGVMNESADPELFLHTSLQDIGLFAGKRGAQQWSTTRWNFAWIAADMAAGLEHEYV